MKSTNFMFICMLLVMAALVCVPVSAHVYVPDYTSKYVNPSDSVIPAGTGTVYVNTRSVNNLFDGSIIIYRVNPTYPYTNEHTIDVATAKKLIVDPTDNETMSFNIDGHQDYLLAAGQFVIELTNGDRGNPEYAYVNVVPGNDYHITFLGHAASIVGVPLVTGPSKSPITIVSAEYVGVWNSNTHKYGLDGHESVAAQIQNYLNANPSVTSFTVYASVGQIVVNGFDVMAPTDKDPAPNWVKTLTVVYSYKDNHGHVKFGGFVIAENDAMGYNDALLKMLPETETIST